MSVKMLIAMFVTVAASFAAPTIVHAAQEKPSMLSATPKPTKSGHAAVNGVNYYYAVYGTGEPLLLLHGGLGQIEMFGPNLTKLAQSRQVIGVDLQGHGRTADIDRPIRTELMADDIAALIRHLKFERPDIMGYSLGGGVAVHTAIRHPELVGKLVVVSTPIRRDAFYPDILAQQGQVGAAAAEAMKQTPMYQLYASIAPKPEDWPVLLTKLGELLRQDYDWSNEVAAIKAPTLLVVGDADSVRTAHAVAFFELLGGGKVDAGWDGSGMSNARLAILPATTHYNIYSSPQLSAVVAPFLDAPMPGAK